MGVEGGYHNSYRRASIYAGYTFETYDRRWALTSAYVTGYNHTKVLLVPSVRLGEHLRLAGFPPVGKHAGLIHLSLEKEL